MCSARTPSELSSGRVHPSGAGAAAAGESDGRALALPFDVSQAATGAALLCLASATSLWMGYRLRPRLREVRYAWWRGRERQVRNPTWLLPSFTATRRDAGAVNKGPLARLVSAAATVGRVQRRGSQVPSTPARLLPWWAALLGPRLARRRCQSNLLSEWKTTLRAPPATRSLAEKATQATASHAKQPRGRPRKARPPSSAFSLPREARTGASTERATTITVKKRKVVVAAAGSIGGVARQGNGAPLIPCELPSSDAWPAPDGASPVTPATLFILQKHAFTTLYHPHSRCPLWCGYYVTDAVVQRAARQHRIPTYFRDPVLPQGTAWTPAQYKRQGFDRGHLGPHAAVAVSDHAALEAAMLTNIALQDCFVNRRVWRTVETLPRALVAADASGAAGAKGGSGKAEILRWLFARQSDVEGTGCLTRGGDGDAQRRRCRQLAVCTGPLFSPGSIPPHRRAPAHTSAAAALKQKRRSSAAGASRRPAKKDVADDATPPEKSEPPLHIPHAFYMTVWEPDTDAHVALIVPNAQDTPMAALIRAEEASKKARQQRSSSAPSAPAVADHATARKRARRKNKKKRHAKPPTAVDTTATTTSEDAERWCQLLQHYVVPMRELEKEFTASVRFLAHLTGDKPLLDVHAHFFPVYQKRYRVRMWWPRLRQRVRSQRRLAAWLPTWRGSQPTIAAGRDGAAAATRPM